MARRVRATAALPGLLIALALVACSGSKENITIVAGSENSQLEPMVREFCETERAECTFRYMGSLDIGLGLKSGGSLEADVVWPAASIWIDIFDSERKVRDLKSISQSPVLLGVRKSKAESLGWIGRPVLTHEILDAVEAGKLTFLMSSATQSNSGASAYLAMLATMVGTDVLTAADLDKPELRAQIRKMLSGVARTSGSSGWLAELFLDQDSRDVRYDAMWNYEFVLKETNDGLVARGSEPLYFVYPADGVAVADAPIGYLDHGQGQGVHDFVQKLQEFLLSEKSQAKIAGIGRRVGLGRSDQGKPVPDWNFDPSRPVTAIRPPEPEVILSALNLYQEALRRPSLSALCLDVSGSMEGAGIEQLHDAMRFLFTAESTRDLLVQWSPDDRIIMIPFSGRPGIAKTGTGAPADQDRLRDIGVSLTAGGGTDMYSCASNALAMMRDEKGGEGSLPAVLILTDGKSDDHLNAFLAEWKADGRRVPVFGILFGDADVSQLEQVAKETGGRVFDGRTGLVEAFRSARGYN